ncbi:MAG: serine hydrolase domain-containing protein [Flavobacteriales bacterium]
MKFLKRFLQVVLALIVFLILGLYATGTDYLIKAIRCTYLQGYTTASIDDGKYFDQNVILAHQPTLWKKHELYGKFDISDSLRNELQTFKTAQFVIIKDGKLLYENTFRDDLKIFNSFSMTKSVTTLLLGFAIQDGYIKDVNQKMIDFLPEYKNDSYGQKATVGDLAKMSSGYGWVEDYYWPVNAITDSYYGEDVEKVVFDVPFVEEPGKRYEYLSGATQLLGIVIKRATGKTLSGYLQEKIWTPLGMETDARWTVDHKGGTEKAFCCLQAKALDYAKIGQFLLQDGQWNGRQILNKEFINLMKTPDLDPIYGYSLWIDENYQHPFYMLRGHLGQYTIVVPDQNLVIVRIGEMRDKRPHNLGSHPLDVYIFIEETIKSLNKIS